MIKHEYAKKGQKRLVSFRLHFSYIQQNQRNIQSFVFSEVVVFQLDEKG